MWVFVGVDSVTIINSSFFVIRFLDQMWTMVQWCLVWSDETKICLCLEVNEFLLPYANDPTWLFVKLMLRHWWHGFVSSKRNYNAVWTFVSFNWIAWINNVCSCSKSAILFPSNFITWTFRRFPCTKSWFWMFQPKYKQDYESSKDKNVYKPTDTEQYKTMKDVEKASSDVSCLGMCC